METLLTLMGITSTLLVWLSWEHERARGSK